MDTCGLICGLVQAKASVLLQAVICQRERERDRQTDRQTDQERDRAYRKFCNIRNHPIHAEVWCSSRGKTRTGTTAFYSVGTFKDHISRHFFRSKKNGILVNRRIIYCVSRCLSACVSVCLSISVIIGWGRDKVCSKISKIGWVRVCLDVGSDLISSWSLLVFLLCMCNKSGGGLRVMLEELVAQPHCL